MPIETNLNVAPFFDDYNEEKNFHRVLFRPAVPIQARELTQLQTILQNQFERFGDNIYKQGTILKGCNFNFDYNYYYVKILDLQVDGQTVVPSNYNNTYAVHVSSNLQALVVNYSNGLESQDPDTNILFVKYLNVGNTGGTEKKTFANSDVLRLYDRTYPINTVVIDSGGTLYSNSDTIAFTGNTGSGAAASLVTYANGTIRSIVFSSKGSGYISAPTLSITTSTGSGAQFTVKNYIADVTIANSSFTANSTTPVGTGTAVNITDGVIYQKGNFIRVEEQTTVIDKFSREPDGLVLGFQTIESIVNNDVDTTLLDNAQGYSNYSAPGAYRLKLAPQLIVKTKEDAAANSEFFSLVEFERGKIVKRRTETEFNSVSAKLAKRTAEESGDYVVRPFSVYTEGIAGNTTHLDISVSSGIGYIDGYRVELEDVVRKPVRKATDTANLANQIISANYGNYVLVKEMLGNFDFTSGATVNLRNTAATDITDNFGGSPTTPGSLIGTAKIRSLVYHSGTVGTPSAVYRMYLFDITMNQSFSFADVRSIQVSGGAADCVVEEGSAQLKDTDFDSLLFDSGVEAVKQFTDEQFIYRTVSDTTFDTGGVATINLTGSEYFPYTAGATLNDVQVQDFIIVPSANVTGSTNLSGTISTSGNVVTGVGTSFLSQLDAGDYIKFQGSSNFFRVSAVTSSTSLTVDGAGPSSLLSNTYTLAFPKNVPVRMDRGTANVTIDGTRQQATIYLGNNVSSSTSSKIYYNIQVSSAPPKTKTVKKNVYVKLSTSKISSSLTGPWCLGIPDVYQIDAVYVGSSNTYSNTTTNYAENFELVTGQTDNVYNLASLKRKPGGSLALSNTSSLLVKLSCFTHGSGYYLSTESYPVNDGNTYNSATEIRTENIPSYLSPSSGEFINLRNAIDFRPIVANTANVNATSVAGATVDPSDANVLAGSLYFPSPNENFQADVEHFLRRADLVVMDQYGQVIVVEGRPSDNPEPPRAPDIGMVLATVHLPPYPSLSPKDAIDSKRPEYASLVKQNQVKGYTMSDIKGIEDRIKNLEYYSLLSLLEKDATDLVIPSESNTSLSRFKNGFFVDPFSSYDISDVNSPEYKITIDPTKSIARPQIDQKMIDLVANTSASSNVAVNGDLVSLSYTDVVYTQQELANRFRRVTQSTWNFKGSMQLYPPYDNHYDTTTKPVNFTIDLAGPMNQLINSINSSVDFKGDGKFISQSATSWQTVSRSGGRRPWQTDARQLFTTTTNVKTSITAGSTTTETQKIGDFVSDFSLSPYMRAQWVSFVASGLRPNGRHYVYFDKRPVSELTRPAIFETVALRNLRSTFGFNRSRSTSGFRVTGRNGDALIANSSGMLTGQFYIEPQKYFCGDREVLVVDVDDIDSLDTAVSKATCVFSAFNFNKQMSSTSITTKKPGNIAPVTTINRSTTVQTQFNSYRIDPLAQTFAIGQNDGTDGVYITKVDLYFKQKDPNLGITIQLRETENGVPAPKILAQKMLISDDINVSNNSSTVTTVTFNSPVYLRDGRDYALVLLPDGDSPEYLVWTAAAGEPDILTNVAKNKDWGNGTMFLSANDKVWTPVQSEDLKFTLYCASFTPTSGTVVFENDNVEFLSIANTQGSFTVGEDIAQKSNTYLNISFTGNNSSGVITPNTNISGTVAADDYVLIVYGNNAVQATGTVDVSSGSNTVTGSTTTFLTNYAVGDYMLINTQLREIVSIANNTQLQIDAPLGAAVSGNNHFSVTDSYQISRVLSSNTTSVSLKDYLEQNVDNSAVFASMQKVVRGVLTQIGKDDTLVIDDSNAANSSFLFQATKRIVGSRSDATAVIQSVNNNTFNFIEPHLSTHIPPLTSVVLTERTDKVSGSAANNLIAFGVSNKTSAEVQIRSRSNEITQLSGSKSLRLFASMTRNANTLLLSPVVDTNPVSALIMKNLINDDATGESTRYGNSQVRYISKRVVLADKLDAEDIKVYITAYKPPSSSILVYGKFLNATDTADFDDKDWTLLQQETEANLYSDQANETNYIEYVFSPKLTPPSSALDGRVETNSNTTLTGVGTSFASTLAANDYIKIVNGNSDTAYEVNIVASVANNTQLTLVNATGPYSNTTSTGFTIEKITQPHAAFKYEAGDGLVLRYYNTNGGLQVSYKTYAIKIVLLSSTTHYVPILKDVRAIAVSV